MKKLFLYVLILSIALWAGCGSDKGTGNDGNGEQPFTRLVANTSVAEPTLSGPDEAMWSSVAGATAKIVRSGPIGKAVGKAALVPGTIDIKAIAKNGSLYMRFEWVDDSLHLWRDVWTLFNVDAFNFSRGDVFHEDQLFAMFTADTSEGWDSWDWRSLTTNPGNLAEGFTYHDGQLTRHAGVQAVAALNYNYLTHDESRPKWIHKDRSAFKDPILYKSDVVSSDFPGPGWTVGQKVPGWIIDTSVVSLLAQSPESRWDVRTAFVYDHPSHKMKLVMGRKLNTGFVDDLNMAALDSVQCRLGVLDHQDTLTVNNSSQQGFCSSFWLILK